MKKITFLGPIGATFSHDAYSVLSGIYDTPSIRDKNCIPVNSNRDILRTTIEHGGYGSIAMETLAEGRISETVESFIDLLKLYSYNEHCPISVIGAIKLRIHFCLMARRDISLNKVCKVMAHQKALGACRRKIKEKGWETVNSTSNGESARLIAEDKRYKNYTVIGPRSASKKYGLRIVEDCFEDEEAVTTFFLIGPLSHKVSIGKENRIIIVFSLPHIPGALVDALLPFKQKGLSLIQIYSNYYSKSVYHFSIEISLKKEEIKSFNQALIDFKRCIDLCLIFGPFEVILV